MDDWTTDDQQSQSQSQPAASSSSAAASSATIPSTAASSSFSSSSSTNGGCGGGGGGLWGGCHPYDVAIKQQDMDHDHHTTDEALVDNNLTTFNGDGDEQEQEVSTMRDCGRGVVMAGAAEDDDDGDWQVGWAAAVSRDNATGDGGGGVIDGSVSAVVEPHDVFHEEVSLAGKGEGVHPPSMIQKTQPHPVGENAST